MQARRLAALIVALSIFPAVAGAATVTGSVAILSDDVFRGISQSLGDPAAQAGLRVQSDAGGYWASWGSSPVFSGDGSRAEVAISAAFLILETAAMPTWLLVLCAVLSALAALYLFVAVVFPEKF